MMRLEDLSFVDSVRASVPERERMSGTISGSLMPTCASLENEGRPVAMNGAGQVISSGPQHVWDTEWKSEFCARKRIELEALLDVKL